MSFSRLRMATDVSVAPGPSGPLDPQHSQFGVPQGSPDDFDFDTQTDSLREMPDLHQALIDIDEELGEDDLDTLKFLCRDHIPVSKLDKAESALEIFDYLKKLLVIVDNNQDFLLECLGRIHRFDLVKKLHLQPDAVRSHLNNFKQLTKFRVLLMNIIDDLDEREVEQVRFFLRGRIRKKPLNERKSLVQLFVFMEQEGLLTPDSVDLLIQVMESIRRGDLVDEILAFKGLPPKYRKMEAGLQPGTPYSQLPPQHGLAVGGGNLISQRGLTDPKMTGGSAAGQEENLDSREASAGTLSVSSEESDRITAQVVIPEPLLLQIANDLKSQATNLGIELNFSNEELSRYEDMFPESLARTVELLKAWQARTRDKGRIPSNLCYVLNKLGFKKTAGTLKTWMDSFNPSQGPPQLPAGSQHAPGAQFAGLPYGPTGPPEHSENKFVSFQEARPYRDSALHLQHNVQQQQISERQQQQQQQQQDLSRIQQLQINQNQIPTERHLTFVDNIGVYQQGDRIVATAGISRQLDPAPVPINSAPNVGQQMQRNPSQVLPATITPVNLELPAYRMDRKPRGWCVIINNEQFTVERGDAQAKEMPPRAGTENDAQSLQYIFQKLGFIVRRHDNLKDTEMMSKLIDVAHNVDHTQFDCFVCCILTHGVLGYLYGSNGRLISIKDLTATFQTNRCLTLAGKPKLFFLQACQGRDKMEGGEIERDGVQVVRPHSDDLATDQGNEMIPNEADFLLGYATVPGYVSFRSRHHGSWYIRKLCELLDKYYDRYDLMSILVEVNREVAHANASMDGGLFKQIPAPSVTLRKQLYFR